MLPLAEDGRTGRSVAHITSKRALTDLATSIADEASLDLSCVEPETQGGAYEFVSRSYLYGSNAGPDVGTMMLEDLCQYAQEFDKCVDAGVLEWIADEVLDMVTEQLDPEGADAVCAEFEDNCVWAVYLWDVDPRSD